MRLILLTMALTLASPAFGGAWMRAEGTGFFVLKRHSRAE